MFIDADLEAAERLGAYGARVGRVGREVVD